MLELPGPMEMQSSPVEILEFKIVTPVEDDKWIPSVFGLSPGAEMLTPCSLALVHAYNRMWNIWLFNDLKLLITMFWEW